jgi:hypothetical protein
MAVGFRAASTAGASEQAVTSIDVPVPSGVQADDIVLVGLNLETASTPTVVPPSGFSSLGLAVSGNARCYVYGKTLTGADTGSYTFSGLAGWVTAHGLAATGASLTGAQVDDAVGSGTSIGSASVTTSTAPFLAHFIANAPSFSAKTPPTGFTQGNESGYLESSYRIPGSSGAQTTSGASQDASTNFAVLLVGLEEASAGPPPTAPTLRVVRSNLRIR